MFRSRSLTCSSFCFQSFRFMHVGGPLLLAVISFAGCGTEKRDVIETNTSVADSSASSANKRIQTSSVIPSKSEAAISPAETSALPPVDATPADVCRRFMELLQSGNRLAAENLLTRTALTATSKAGLKLEPMGSTAARYEMGETRFATIKNELAQVDCEIIDNLDGIESHSPVVWLVRKQNLGWRIAGLLVQLDPDQPQNLLSFENPSDIEEIKRRASGAVLDELDGKSRQANAKSDPKKLK